MCIIETPKWLHPLVIIKALSLHQKGLKNKGRHLTGLIFHHPYPAGSIKTRPALDHMGEHFGVGMTQCCCSSCNRYKKKSG